MNNHGAGAGRAMPRSGKNVYQELKLSLEEAYHGAKKHLKTTLFVPCDACLTQCTVCRGSGMQIKILQMIPGFQQQTMVPCGSCRGVGWCGGGHEACTECKGRRTLQQDVSKMLDIPPGVDEGMNVEIDGWGEQIPKGTPGKLILTIKIDVGQNAGTAHRVERHQHHLKVTFPIHFIECVTGKQIDFKHPSGSSVTLNTRRFGEVIQPNRTYTIKGKGMPVMNTGGGGTAHTYGDLILMFEVTYDKLRDDVKSEDVAQLTDVYKRMVVVPS
jgi:DnaJ-class molecular chaperone